MRRRFDVVATSFGRQQRRLDAVATFVPTSKQRRVLTGETPCIDDGDENKLTCAKCKKK